MAVYVTGDGVILVDDMFYRNYDDILAKVASVTDSSVAYVLNTHQHDDHAGGNAKMLALPASSRSAVGTRTATPSSPFPS